MVWVVMVKVSFNFRKDENGNAILDENGYRILDAVNPVNVEAVKALSIC